MSAIDDSPDPTCTQCGSGHGFRVDGVCTKCRPPMTSFSEARAAYKRALAAEWAAHPDLHGVMFRPKRDPENPWRNYAPTSFSHTLIDIADGVEMLLKHWEPEERER